MVLKWTFGVTNIWSTPPQVRASVCVLYQIRLIYRQIWMGSRACSEFKYLFPPTFCTCLNIVRQVLAGTTWGAIFHPPSVAIFNTEPCWFLSQGPVLKLHRYLWSLSEWTNHDWCRFLTFVIVIFIFSFKARSVFQVCFKQFDMSP